MPLSPLPREAFVTEHCLASSNQRGANSVTVAPWHTKSVPRMLITSKAAFLENYLAVSAWILNGHRLPIFKILLLASGKQIPLETKQTARQVS